MTSLYKVGSHKTTVKNTDEQLVVTYHSTDVVTFDKVARKIVLNTGGWESATTKMRMNQAANVYNLPYHVYQKDFVWYVDSGDNTIEFNNNIAVIEL